MKHNYASSTAVVKLRSGEHRRISIFSWASYGRLSNSGHKFNVFTKAGHSRWIGKRPVVRGEAMNPVDHPHGGNTSGGTYPRTPWGKLAKGVRTRSKRNFSNSIIVRSRHLFKK
jgi:large subunit ribosomal protein L2